MSIGQRTRVGRLKIRVDRLVYTTITLVSVLIIYDGWNRLRFWDVLAVILGPMLAIFLSHLFGAELGTRVALGRALTGHERRRAFVEECRFLIILVPPLLILIVLSVAGVSYSHIIQVIVLVGVASLGVWGGCRTPSRAYRVEAGRVRGIRPPAGRRDPGSPGPATAWTGTLSAVTDETVMQPPRLPTRNMSRRTPLAMDRPYLLAERERLLSPSILSRS